MKLAAFDPQLSDKQLQELGRMTVNFGYAELLLDWLLLSAFNIRNQTAIRTLVSPLATRRKIELIEAQLATCPSEEAKHLIDLGLKEIEKANDDRNQIMHGYWAERNGEVLAYFRKAPEKSRVTPASVSQIADNVASATRALYQAYNLLNKPSKRLPENWLPHILRPQEDGSYDVVVPAALRA